MSTARERAGLLKVMAGPWWDPINFSCSPLATPMFPLLRRPDSPRRAVSNNKNSNSESFPLMMEETRSPFNLSDGKLVSVQPEFAAVRVQPADDDVIAALSGSQCCLHCGGKGAESMKSLMRQLYESKLKLLETERELTKLRLEQHVPSGAGCANGCKGDDNKATHWCRQCDAAICGFCVMTHGRQAHLFDHVLIETRFVSFASGLLARVDLACRVVPTAPSAL